MNTESTANNVSTLPAPTAPKTSREVIQANVDLLIQQLEAGHSEGLTAYLTAMGRFHNYSFGNILEIARQRPDATRVAGLYAWNQLGRKVMKGQKGIRILAPMIGTRKKKDNETTRSSDPAAVNKPVLVGFRAVYVFDVSQTEGAELPGFTERTRGEVGEFNQRLQSFVEAQGIALEFKDSIAPALGHELRRTHRHPSRSGTSRGVQHPCSRTRARDVAQGRTPHRHHQNRTRDRSRGNRFRRLADNRP